MTFDYARLKSTADRLLANFGQAATLRRLATTGPAYNPTSITPADYACKVVVEDFRANEIDGTRVEATDKKVLMAKGALTIEPSTTDKLLIGGEPHSIVRVEPMSPAGAVVYYVLQCRR